MVSQSMPASRAAAPTRTTGPAADEDARSSASEERAAPRALGHDEVEEHQAAALLAASLRASRSQGRAALERHRRQEPQSWTLYLLPAARQLERTLTEFLHFDPVWTALRTAEATTGLLDDELVEQFGLAFDQDIAGLLDYLGYSPPPLAQEWARDVVEAVADVLADADCALASGRARQAEHNLTLFLFRLRGCIEQADAADSPEATVPSVRQRLAAAVQRAVVTAGPAVLATSTVALAFPGQEVATVAAGLGLAANAAGAKALDIGVTAASGALLAKVTAEEPQLASPEAALEAATVRVVDVVRSLSRVLEPVRNTGGRSDLVRPLSIEAVSSIYALRTVMVRLPPSPGHRHLGTVLDDTVHALVELIDAGTTHDGDMSTALQQAEGGLLTLLSTMSHH